MLRWALFLLLFVSGLSAVIGGEKDDLVRNEEATQQGKGVIIELEEKKSDKAADRKNTTGRKQVELIVGGQGEDGVARRGTLKVED